MCGGGLIRNVPVMDTTHTPTGYVSPTQELGIALWRAQCLHLFDVLTTCDCALADDGGDYVTAAIDLTRSMNYICADGEVHLDWLDRLLNTPYYLSDRRRATASHRRSTSWNRLRSRCRLTPGFSRVGMGPTTRSPGHDPRAVTGADIGRTERSPRRE